MIFRIVGDLTGLGVIVQTIQHHGWMANVPGQALSRLMVVRRHGIALEYREARMTP